MTRSVWLMLAILACALSASGAVRQLHHASSAATAEAGDAAVTEAFGRSGIVVARKAFACPPNPPNATIDDLINAVSSGGAIEEAAIKAIAQAKASGGCSTINQTLYETQVMLKGNKAGTQAFKRAVAQAHATECLTPEAEPLGGSGTFRSFAMYGCNLTPFPPNFGLTEEEDPSTIDP